MEKELDYFKDFNLIDFYKDQEEKDLFEAKQEVLEIFSRYVKLTDKISISAIQRKLSIGYAKAAHFVELMEIKNILEPTIEKVGVRRIVDKKKFVKEAVKFFSKIIRDKKKD